VPTYYLDYVNGDDGNAGDSFAAGHPWKTLTLGATAAIIAPGDIIKIAKSPAPYSIGHADWTSLSRTVTLETAQNVTIDLCEVAWTSDHGTASRLAVATDAKEGAYCCKIIADASPGATERQAYYNCADVNLGGYQKISFWIKNEVAIDNATDWVIQLCDDDACTNPVDTFPIPAIPSTGRWLPLTIARTGGGNLNASVKGIRVVLGATTPTASKYIYLDDIIACTTSGLSLQSLISKNSAEQGGTEGWYGLQSIVGVTLTLDTTTDCKAGVGRGYWSATTPEHITTYARETIKTALGTANSTVIQQVMDSGTVGNNIEFQGGYDTGTGNPTGETFFDGLNGFGYGVVIDTKSYITMNYISVTRYYHGIRLSGATYCTFPNITSATNCLIPIMVSASNYNTFTLIGNVSMDYTSGITVQSSAYFNNFVTITNALSGDFGSGVSCNSSFNTFGTIVNACNNTLFGVSLNGARNYVGTVSNAANNVSHGFAIQNGGFNIGGTVNAYNNATYGVYFNNCHGTRIRNLTTSGNTSGGIGAYGAMHYYVDTATIAEAIKVAGIADYTDGRVSIANIGGVIQIWTDNANIVTQAATAGGTGIEWKMNVTNALRNSAYPLKLIVAEFAALTTAQVTITLYFKKSSTDIAASFVLPGSQLGGPAADTVTPCPDDTNRNQLQIQFNPTAAGVFYVEAWAWWAANLADESVIIDDISITQA